MFSVTDKMASVLKPLQLLEMKLGATEIKYDERNQLTFFLHAKDLIQVKSNLVEGLSSKVSTIFFFHSCEEMSGRESYGKNQVLILLI